MNTPNVSLMRAYGTDAVFKEKTANVAPIAHRIAEIAMGRGILAQHIQGTQHEARHSMQAEIMNTAFRMLELARLENAIDNANHTQAPIILPAGYGEDMPLGLTEGMIRIASAAGGSLAKTAGPFRTPGIMPMPAIPAMAANPARTAVSGMKLKPRVQAATASAVPMAASSAAPVEAAAPAASALGQKLHGAWEQSGLGGPHAGKKMLALGAFGLGTLGALKGLGYVKKKMEEETPPRPYRNAGNQLAPDLNEYGQTQPGNNTY